MNFEKNYISLNTMKILLMCMKIARKRLTKLCLYENPLIRIFRIFDLDSWDSQRVVNIVSRYEGRLSTPQIIAQTRTLAHIRHKCWRR